MYSATWVFTALQWSQRRTATLQTFVANIVLMSFKLWLISICPSKSAQKYKAIWPAPNNKVHSYLMNEQVAANKADISLRNWWEPKKRWKRKMLDLTRVICLHAGRASGCSFPPSDHNEKLYQTWLHCIILSSACICPQLMLHTAGPDQPNVFLCTLMIVCSRTSHGCSNLRNMNPIGQMVVQFWKGLDVKHTSST